ncbi:hypothetical protein WOLCODRAFT_29268 [Wolfiporia cocos MD-104 SS10]|uniref:RING-type domain-containing protein n=1 Tax=Wolfiporia cocos (strain MD-104) TaxID=742152 RepID=A0A2H3JBH2_WOLCO|nr:hypothetical protein WOLCODRAFT_29268 [Wolfiporia cocos MD-104 SS10]
MLIVHPASTCDVCLDPYSWEAPGNCPHAIACGHVFCLNCLRSLDPSLCPLCRKAFDPSRIKKLHIDRYTPTDSQGMPIVGRTEEDELLHRIALFFGDSASDEDVNEVLEEVREWLASHTPGAHPTWSFILAASIGRCSLPPTRFIDTGSCSKIAAQTRQSSRTCG